MISFSLPLEQAYCLFFIFSLEQAFRLCLIFFFFWNKRFACSLFLLLLQACRLHQLISFFCFSTFGNYRFCFGEFFCFIVINHVVTA